MKNKTSPFTKIKNAGISCGLLTATAVAASAHADPSATNSTVTATAVTAAPATNSVAAVPPPTPMWQKPAWLTDLSAGTRETYDNNVLLVSGNGMGPQYSWITTVSAKVGLNFAPLLGDQHILKTFTLVYSPDFNFYNQAPQETYNAQRFGDSIKASAGNLAFSLDNAFLYNDGSRVAPIYAESQAAGGNTDDRYRNFFAQAVPRERRRQIQDRGTVAIQYNVNNFFVRPTASTIYYNLDTIFHNAGVAPYIGYQNWPDRYDANGGADAGYQLTPGLAVTAGYRYGHQYQMQFPEDITPTDRHFSSSDYQRALIGLEGNLASWLTAKISAGPDFRDYNSMAPVSDYHPIYPFAEATVTANLSANQTLAFYTKEWEWVASTGLVPYYDSLYSLNYHWNATRHWGFDLGGKLMHANFAGGDDFAGTAPSLRNDIEYSVALGVTYNFTQNLNVNVAYNYNLGRNLLDDLAAKYAPSYRNFNEDLLTFGVQYKF